MEFEEDEEMMSQFQCVPYGALVADKLPCGLPGGSGYNCARNIKKDRTRSCESGFRSDDCCPSNNDNMCTIMGRNTRNSYCGCLPDGYECGKSWGIGEGADRTGSSNCYKGSSWAHSHREGWSSEYDIWVIRSNVCCDGYAMGEPNTTRSAVTARAYYCRVNGCWERKSDLILSFIFVLVAQTKNCFSLAGKTCGTHGTFYNTGCYLKRRNGNEWAGCCSGKIQQQGPAGSVL